MIKHLRPLFPYLSKYKTGLVLGTLCVLGTNGIKILFPQVIRYAINGLNSGVTHPKLIKYSLLLVLISAGAGLFSFLTRWIVIGISRDIEFDLRNDLFRHLETLPFSY